ncbi:MULTISPECIES: geranylgeranyl reductase family protein [unclassified Tenacibaculum]|uniref:geranylgeranyl reductase family protein n=1 Tax=unclassified Tenacibaculum TaxID=2635139 RepID=UPI001F4257AF|nr:MULTISPECIES: geranylgeranyl reductase family protein [unclassified Tenacibaculum]MCF2874151.1 geranylgeranyl reductase family protein [Tenacibaculum sp. Cn5-1]MCF2934732.1 geranylgeranyl reductase family protein [Tenacibaculum sp. Cn5-34]MCG7510942.1 geranylgeranyl reductase family protein [Tenacibaculum sp. Cn5-46]
MNHYDVAVIGSGPSGASTAFHLAKQGISTVIIEKETLPRYKTCGGGFVYRGRKDLPFDITEVVEKEFHTVDVYLGKKLHFKTHREKPTISMVMRDSFDNLITKKAKEFGATLLENHKLKGLSFDNNVITLETSQGNLTANFVIAADGALSPTAKLAGWKEDTRKLIPALEYEVEVSDEDFERLSKEVRFDIDAIPFGYAWSFPKKNHLSLGVASARRTKINLKKFYKEYLQTLGINNIVSESQHGFQIPVAPRTDGFVKNNVFLIGDAAGFADPITAEGISNAIYSGKLAAEAIIETNKNLELAGKLYEEKLENTLLPEIKTGLWLAKWFYEQKTIRNLLLSKYGQHFSEAMADVFHGDRNYPKDVKASIKKKIKSLVF